MRARIVAALAVILACAGCSGTPQPRASQASGVGATPAAVAPAGSASLVVNSVSSPGCSTASALRANPAHALLAVVRVGQAPVGLRLVRNGTLIVVADSNRFVGLFPREMALVPGGQQLLVTNYASGQLEAVSVASISQRA
jgi:DNA-binding beta-propeller fold protein YncE